MFQNSISALSIPPDQLDAFILVGIAALLSGLIGLEREAFKKPAGFRTNMLVGGASALLVVLSRVLVLSFEKMDGVAPFLRTDPIRVFEAIIVGVSFIGAGTILKVPDKDRIRYITTAASLLLSAGVGIAVALRQFHLAGAVVLTALVITLGLGNLHRLFRRRDRQ